MLYTLTTDDQAYGPSAWTQAFAATCGLSGNAAPPADKLPMTIPAGVLDAAAPEPVEIEDSDEVRGKEIVAELAGLDAATVRPLRAVLAATQAGADPDAEDVSRLATLEAQAVALRVELAELQ